MTLLFDRTISDAQRLWEWTERTACLEALTNGELATAVEDHLWETVPLLTPASDLLWEVCKRLREKERP